MNFTSSLFFAFFSISLGVFYFLPAKYRAFWILLCSYGFYGFWSIQFLFVLVLSTSIDYWLSKTIEKNRSSSKIKDICVVIGVTTNLSILFFFKYLNFSLGIYQWLARVFQIKPIIPEHIDIILPLGISFFTFEAISYLMDVYRGKRAAANFLTYNFYIMFFPHLIAGPIVRFNQLVNQYQDGIHRPDLATIINALRLTLFGYFFKVVIANNCALISDSCFDISQINPLRAWVGCTAFSAQLYFDFMGYTHIARGISLLFNISLPLNFDHPFNAPSITEFWQRWHMSLTKWLRDYLFVPLSRRSRSTTGRCISIFIVMLTVGAWHGAGWTYMIFGAIHGLLMMFHYIWTKIKTNIVPTFFLKSNVYSSIAATVTTILVIASTSFFRSENVGQACMMCINLAQPFTSASILISEINNQDYSSLVTLLILLSCIFSGKLVVRFFDKVIFRRPFWLQSTLACFAIVLMWLAAADDFKQFIYFQF